MIEYKLIDLEIDANELTMTGINLDGRRKLNKIVEDKINEMSKEGWTLHSSGIITIPVLLFYKEKRQTRRK